MIFASLKKRQCRRAHVCVWMLQKRVIKLKPDSHYDEYVKPSHRHIQPAAIFWMWFSFVMWYSFSLLASLLVLCCHSPVSLCLISAQRYSRILLNVSDVKLLRECWVIVRFLCVAYLDSIGKYLDWLRLVLSLPPSLRRFVICFITSVVFLPLNLCSTVHRELNWPSNSKWSRHQFGKL